MHTTSRNTTNPEYTGEFFIPEHSSNRMRIDNEARYAHASMYVKNKIVLDIACGSGYGTKKLAEAGAKKVIGMDISDDALRVAQKHHSHPNISYEEGDLLEIPYKDYFDVIMSSETIEHTPEYMKALQQLYNALKTGGVLILTTPNRRVTNPQAKTLDDPIPYPYHTQEFTATDLRKCLENTGFTPRKTTILGHRQQFLFPTKIIRHIYKKLFAPNHTLSPKYEPKKLWRHPRNLLSISTK